MYYGLLVLTTAASMSLSRDRGSSQITAYTSDSVQLGSLDCTLWPVAPLHVSSTLQSPLSFDLGTVWAPPTRREAPCGARRSSAVGAAVCALVQQRLVLQCSLRLPLPVSLGALACRLCGVPRGRLSSAVHMAKHLTSRRDARAARAGWRPARAQLASPLPCALSWARKPRLAASLRACRLCNRLQSARASVRSAGSVPRREMQQYRRPLD